MSWPRFLAPILALALAEPTVGAEDWENPVFEQAEDAVRAARTALLQGGAGESGARELFTRFTLSAAERPSDRRFANVRRRVVGDFLITLPAYLEDDSRAQRTLRSFLDEVEGEKAAIVDTLERFGYPELPGLIYLKLVDNVDELQDPGRPSSQRQEQIQGVTYYCRYVVIPLSYVTAESLRQLRGSALEPGTNVNSTLRAWHRESLRTMVRTFRHELVHVWTNSSLGVPRYRDRKRYPTWFLEGSAAFLAADPHSGLSERYQRYQNLFFYLVERHGVKELQDFFGRILGGASVRQSLELGGASVRQSLEDTYGISGSGDLREWQKRWRGVKDTIAVALTIALLLIVVLALSSRRLPVFGSLQLWLALTLAYATFSGLCENTQALNGATAVLVQQATQGAAALYLAFRGLRSARRSLRP